MVTRFRVELLLLKKLHCIVWELAYLVCSADVNPTIEIFSDADVTTYTIFVMQTTRYFGNFTNLLAW